MTKLVPVLTKIACVASVLTAVACSGTTSDDARAKSTSSAASTPNDVEEEGNADKVICAVDADCDSDERCESGRCAGLDGDRD